MKACASLLVLAVVLGMAFNSSGSNPNDAPSSQRIPFFAAQETRVDDPVSGGLLELSTFGTLPEPISRTAERVERMEAMRACHAKAEIDRIAAVEAKAVAKEVGELKAATRKAKKRAERQAARSLAAIAKTAAATRKEVNRAEKAAAASRAKATAKAAAATRKGANLAVEAAAASRAKATAKAAAATRKDANLAEEAAAARCSCGAFTNYAASQEKADAMGFDPMMCTPCGQKVEPNTPYHTWMARNYAHADPSACTGTVLPDDMDTPCDTCATTTGERFNIGGTDIACFKCLALKRKAMLGAARALILNPPPKAPTYRSPKKARTS